MELRVIGCDGSYPAARGATSGYLVDCGEGGQFLLDCGSGVLSRLMALMDPRDITAIVITHWHNDHACDLLVLRYYLQIHGARLPVCAPETDQALRSLCVGEEFDLRDIAEGFQLGDVMMTSQAVKHPVPSYAVRIEHQGKSLVYTGDLSAWEDTVDFCRQADLLVCDASFTRDQWTPRMPHLSAFQAGQLGAHAQVGQLLLTHCPPGNDWQTLLTEGRQAYAQAQFARPGLRLAL